MLLYFFTLQLLGYRIFRWLFNFTIFWLFNFTKFWRYKVTYYNYHWQLFITILTHPNLLCVFMLLTLSVSIMSKTIKTEMVVMKVGSSI